MKKSVAIIGAGACGLVSAIFASEAGAKVKVFERSHKPGRKILASGNGHCNITNENISLRFYHGKEPHFAKDIIKFDARRFFENLGLELRAKKGTRLYPYSDEAKIVLDFLLYECKRKGVEIVTDYEVVSIKKENDKFVINEDEIFDRLIIAAGSSAMPHIGGSESGYDLALSLGHKIEKPFASLVQLITKEEHFFKSSGVKIEANLALLIDKKEVMQKRGDLLFTNYGLSGSAILDLSRSASFALMRGKDVEVVCDLLPDIELGKLRSLLQKRAKMDLTNELWLGGLLPKKLINPLFEYASIKRADAQNKRSINTLSYTVKSLKFKIDSTKGHKKAEVMAGGISTKEIDPKTLESKIVKGLFFCGEVLDIDGDCGGYNLHWAWSSGARAGRSAGVFE